jgi:hypothetical protein
MPLALTDADLATIERYAQPLDPRLRSTFLHRVVALLDGQVVGDGLLGRVCAQAQGELRQASALDEGLHGGKYGR